MDNSTVVYDLLKLIDLALNEGFQILGQYCIVKYTDIKNLIEKVKDELPKEIKQYRIELYKAGYGRTLDYIENMEQLLNRGYNIFNYVVIDTNKFKKLIDGIYADYPSTIQELHKLTNS